jgi:hyperosmotically inducible protein
MKKCLVSIAVAGLAIVGCQQRDQSIRESAGAQKDQVEQSKDAQKDSLDEQKKAVDRQARMQKKQIAEQTDAQKKSIEAQKDAQKAQLTAEQKQIEADAKAQKAQIEANKEVQEAAGAAQKGDNSNSSLEAQVREAIYGKDLTQPTSTSFKNVKVSVKDGVATLKGSVASEADKMDCETKAKSVSGITSVDNQLEIKAQ